MPMKKNRRKERQRARAAALKAATPRRPGEGSRPRGMDMPDIVPSTIFLAAAMAGITNLGRRV